jgi:hypothetical protein
VKEQNTYNIGKAATCSITSFAPILTAYILYHQKVEEGPTTSTMGIILTLLIFNMSL